MKMLFFFHILLFLSANTFGQQMPVRDNIKYILLNRAPGQGMSQEHPESINDETFGEVAGAFSDNAESNVKVGVCFMLSPFRTKPEVTVQTLKNLLNTAGKISVPVMIHLDLEQWWGARPDLWNWWNAEHEGYDAANKENVEWTGWSSDHAIKIAWRNWGSQIRVLPPPNYASPKYLKACEEEIQRLIPIVARWYKALPENKKYLFAGVKVGHESSIGVNAFHYPNGNELLDKDASGDPRTGIAGQDVLARGVQQIGYATLKTGEIRSDGDITEYDLYEATRRYLEFLSRETAECGIARDRLFTHGAGWSDGEMLYDAALNEYACPGWSFYAYAKNPTEEPAVKRNLTKTDAPYWGAVEWMLMDNMNAQSQTQYGEASARKQLWKDALYNTLKDERARLVCIYNWESIRHNEAARSAIQECVNEGIANR